MKNHEVKLGQVLEGPEQRDAIHIAVAPVVANEKLFPGQDIGFVIEGNTERVGVSKNPIGIVDPLLKGPVYPEQPFWMLLYPQTITSLRHEWTHPVFAEQVGDNGDALTAAKKRITEIADVLGMSYTDLMNAAGLWCRHEEYTTEYGSEHWRDTFPEYATEFWALHEIVTGIKTKDETASFFSCSC